MQGHALAVTGGSLNLSSGRMLLAGPAGKIPLHPSL
jgi:hypothetical protein